MEKNGVGIEEKKDSLRNDGKKNLYSGITVIGISVVFVKIIGLIYKIPLMNCIGAEGMGYFNSAYEVYLLFCIIATTGLPTAVSVMISRYRSKYTVGYDSDGISEIYRTVVFVFSIIGLGASLLILFGAGAFSSLIKNSGARESIVAIAPSVFFICLISAVRGYFQGFGNMKHTAVSQVIEALGKLVFGLSFAIIALKRGKNVQPMAAYAVLGMTLGTALSALYLGLAKYFAASAKKEKQDFKRTDSPQNGRYTVNLSRRKAVAINAINKQALVSAAEIPSRKSIIKELFRVAVPITLGSVVLSVTRLFDTVLIMRRLQTIGYPENVANSMFGTYSTLALPIYNLPPSLISGISLSLVPLLAAAICSGNKAEEKSMLQSAFKITAVFAIPASFGICAFSTQILDLLYGNNADAVELASPLLAVLGISVLLSCMITVSNAVLQAYDRAGKPIVSMIAGSVIKLISGYILIGLPGINIMGAPISTLLFGLTVFGMNYYYICKYSDNSKGLCAVFVKPMACGIIAVCNSIIVYSFLGRFIGSDTLVGIAAMLFAVPVYIIAALKTGTLEYDDIMTLPAGDRILKIFGRFLPKNKKISKRKNVKTNPEKI